MSEVSNVRYVQSPCCRISVSPGEPLPIQCVHGMLCTPVVSGAEGNVTTPSAQPEAVVPEVLHFTGRADLESTLVALRNSDDATFGDLARYMRIERTLERAHD